MCQCAKRTRGWQIGSLENWLIECGGFVGKKVKAVVKLQVQAGKATPAPPVGTALGPHGINIMQFCKEYNAKTASMAGMVVPCEITIFQDRSFEKS